MKILKSVLIFLIVFVSIFTIGCNKKSFSQPVLSRDNYNTGGNLTFYYDNQSQTAFFGGEGEIIQFYQEDIAKGWDKKGCRIGVSMLLPKELKDYKSATAEINGKEYNSNDFIVENNQQSLIAQFQPLVSKDNNIIEIKITWEENSISQYYKIIIKNDTIFMGE